MIITVALNPAVDLTLEVDHFQLADTNRVHAVRQDIGGKGINVARSLKALGYEALACGFAPGVRGRQIEDQLLDGGIGCDFIYIPGDVRTNITILDRANHSHTQLALPGPTLPRSAIAQLTEHLRRRVRVSTWLVLAGSIPPPGDPSVYVELIRMAAEHGGRSALDADGPVVEAVLASDVRPSLLKMNDHELARLLHLNIESEAEALGAARRVRERGVLNVVVTLGSDGAVAVTEHGEYRVSAPRIDVVSAVGAGDAFLSGLMYGLVKTGNWETALPIASAAGGAACLEPGTLPCSGEAVWRLRPSVVVERIHEVSAAR
ncbi:MAG: 1-phosphofructokinase family hexose kinase [Chloroflexi bacterium]|nr:MAG: 1-phosphofructokinase family hexose kinase [Chloroflexota bacterium]